MSRLCDLDSHPDSDAPPLNTNLPPEPQHGINASRWANDRYQANLTPPPGYTMPAPHHSLGTVARPAPRGNQNVQAFGSPYEESTYSSSSHSQTPPNGFATPSSSTRRSNGPHSASPHTRRGSGSRHPFSPSSSARNGRPLPRNNAPHHSRKYSKNFSGQNGFKTPAHGYNQQGQFPSQQSTRTKQHPSVYRDWPQWDEVTIDVWAIQPHIDPPRLAEMLSQYGNVVWVSMNPPKDPPGTAQVKFRPPPQEKFWLNALYFELPEGPTFLSADLITVSSKRTSPGPVSLRPYPAVMTIHAQTLALGNLCKSLVFIERSSPASIEQGSVVFEVDLFRRWIEITFNILIPSTNPHVLPEAHAQSQQVKVRLPFQDLRQIFRSEDSKNEFFFFSLSGPPAIYRRALLEELPEDMSQLTENNMWKRAVSHLMTTRMINKCSVRLHEDVAPIINFGSWMTFKIAFLKRGEQTTTPGPRTLQRFEQKGLMAALTEHSIDIKDVAAIRTLEARPTMWELIEAYPDTNKILQWTSQLSNHDHVNLPFELHYQLEVCISNFFIKDTTVTREFLEKLKSVPPPSAQRLLETVCDQKTFLEDPMTMFGDDFRRKCAPVRHLARHCMLSRAAIVTPTTIHFQTPAVDTSNRVLRRYAEYTDRFLRVRFADELGRGRLYPLALGGMDDVYRRIKRTLKHGIQVANRTYKFLAFGNSQFREHGAYFVAETAGLKIEEIRTWMGNFENITSVAKHTARVGQCFSTTKALQTSVKAEEIPDVFRNKYNFTDGVGKISNFLVTMICSEFSIERDCTGGCPSVYQFRHGGNKGVLALSPDLKGQEIQLRPSQNKFTAESQGLEIIRWSQYSAATLNRQLIICLSALGVPDASFLQKLTSMLQSLSEAMTNPQVALDALEKYHDANQTSSMLAKLVSAGFLDSKEPFVTSLLHLWRAWMVKYLKEKARLVIENGAFVLGCTDESQTLKGHFNKEWNSPTTREEEEATLPEIFIQVPDRANRGRYKVIEGICVVARNPSLHPGDIRVVRAVDCPPLRHIRDAVVFPQTGDRDIPSMCSGGDLDGDDFIVIWDPSFIPREWNLPPMSATPSKAEGSHKPVGIDEIIEFFTEYLKNDNLGPIAHNHLAFADQEPYSIKNQNCLDLAELHSKAVDYVKTGEPAVCRQNLFPKMWPHFMEKRGKRADQTYHSISILGKLYDETQRVGFIPDAASRDARLYYACEPTAKQLDDARELKQNYDASLKRIMNRYEIKTEHEVWTTFVLAHTSMSRDYKFHEELTEISQNLKRDYRQQIIELAGGFTTEKLLPLVTAMYRVTVDDAKLYVSQSKQRVGEEALEVPFTSFPWIFSDILCEIVTKGLWDKALHDKALKEEQLISLDAEEPEKPENGGHKEESAEPKSLGGGLIDHLGDSPKVDAIPQSALAIAEELLKSGLTMGDLLKAKDLLQR